MKIGTKLADRYTITGELGRGGMGVVFQAHDPLLDRDVAVKVVTPEFLSPDVEVRFLREAQIIARMDHPAIVTVHDIGRHEGALFFVMPIVRGATLRDLIEGDALCLGDALGVVAQVAGALDYSHSLGVVHRDVKPDNIMVARDGRLGVRARVMDFGLAFATYESQLTRITRRGTLLGTVSYFSPEQVSGRPDIDGRSDIYSLGAILYECFAGTPPFAGDAQAVLYRIVHERPEPPSARGADIDADLEALVLKCLAKRETDRPQTARELAELLQRFVVRLDETTYRREIGRVAGGARASRRPSANSLPLIGRDKELAELVGRLDRASFGDCQLALVSGESGIGKTRLLDELETVAVRQGVCVLHGRVVDADRAFPFQVFCDAIQEYFASNPAPCAAGEDIAELASDLTRVFPSLRDISAIRDAAAHMLDGSAQSRIGDQESIFEVLARVFSRFADASPVLVLLEDIHRGTVSVDALRYLARRLGPARIAFVGTWHRSEVERGHPIWRLVESYAGDRRFVDIALGPLEVSHYGRFLESLLGGRPVAPSTAERLHAATDGNPLFTREIVRALLDAGHIGDNASTTLNLSIEMGLPASALPATIQEAIERRIEGLSPDLRDLLVVASVLGRSFDFGDLEAMHATAELDTLVERLVHRGLLTEEAASRGERLSFSSRVVRDVLYATSSRRRRRTLHRRYAEYLERRHEAPPDRVISQLAHHFALGDVPEKAVAYGMLSARQYLDGFAFESARRALGLVLEFLEYEWEGDRAVEGEARLLMARAHHQLGSVETALREARAAVRIFESAKRPDLAVSAALAAANIAWIGRRVEETKAWIDHALPLARVVNASENLRELLRLAAMVAQLSGETAAARAYDEEYERVGRMHGQTHAEPLRAGSERPERGGRLRVPVGPDTRLERADPLLIATDYHADICANVFETLTRATGAGRVVPWLAERIESGEGAMSFRFTLRAGVCFQDGRPVTPSDVRHTFERILSRPESRGFAALRAIRGAGALEHGASHRLEGFVDESDRTFRVDLDRPIAFFPVLLTDPCTAIVPSGSDPAGTWRDGCVGSGPFRVVGFEPGSRIVLERNPYYWRSPLPYCDRLEFVLNVPHGELLERFRTGEFSIASGFSSADVESLRRSSGAGATFRDAPGLSTAFLAFNCRRGPLADRALRRRVAAAIDVEAVVRRTMTRLTVPATTLVPPSLLGVELARHGAATAATAEPSARVDLTMCASSAFAGRLSPIRNAIVEALAAKGIVLHESGVWLTDLPDVHKTGEVDVILTMWAADYPDPDSFAFSLLQGTDGVFGAFSGTAEVDRLVETARAEIDPQTRLGLYRQVEDAIARDALLLPLYHPQKYRFARPDVAGLAVNPLSFPIVPYDEIWIRS